MTDSKPDYEYEFDPDAENNTAASIFDMAMEGGSRVLDLGSGPGIVAAALTRSGKDTTCIDTESEYLEAALERGVGRTIRADLNDEAWVEEFTGEVFDVIILADVLEHLPEPGSVLDQIRDHELLSDDGYLVISIPNVSHEAVIASLVGGRFDYTPTGLLDATHIRFFTRETFQRLLEEHGFVATRLRRTLRTIEQTELFHTVEHLDEAFRREMNERGQDARTYQYVFRAEPTDAAHELQRLRREVDEESQRRIREVEEARRRFRSEREEVESRLAAAQQELEETSARAQREIQERDEMIAKLSRDLTEERRDKEREIAAAKEELDRLHSDLADRRAELDDRRAELDDLRRRYEEQFDARQQHRQEAERLRRKLDDVYASETWRAGRAIMWLPRRLKVAARSTSSSDDEDEESEGVRPARRRIPSRLRPAHELTEDRDLRSVYRAAIDRRDYRYSDRTHVAVTVSTADLDEGRGDLFTSVGIGRYLEEAGYECIYLPPDEWYDIPDGTDIYLSLLAEPRFMLDPARMPDSCLLIGWIRNNTERWLGSRTLRLYDGLLCSSERTLNAVAGHYGGPLEILRIGVDDELFDAGLDNDRNGVAATVNQWGKPRDTYRALSGLEIDFPLAIYGVQRGLSSDLEPFSRGPVSYFQIPSLYEQVGIVLDDQQDVNRPYGNVNSRIFESLAAGALPVTATANGLSEVGLDGVPSYGSPHELRTIVHRYLDSPDERRALVEELRDEVLEQHTYAQRAKELHSFITEIGDRRHGTEQKFVAFQPDYTVTNPYQDLLYSQLAEGGAVAAPSDAQDVMGIARPSSEQRIFHLHWTATILGPATSRTDAEARKDRFLSEVDRVRGSGARFIWTIHNVLPHECAFPEVEIELRRGLAGRADAIHVMCKTTLDEVASLYPLPPERVHIVAHGSYLDVYPNIVSEERARSDLGLGPDERVLLFFGQIRPYKGLDRLLDAFEALRRPDLRLLVAGSPGRFEGVHELVERCRRTEGVVARLEEVPDVEVQRYFNACDVVVLPHRKVLNSGGVMLAFSFGRPVIAPRAGCLTELVTPDVGRLFDPDGEDLEDIIGSVDDVCTPQHRSAAFDVAKSYPYTAMGTDFLELLTDPG